MDRRSNALISDDEHFHVSGIPEPIQSPDLTAYASKACVYSNLPHTIQDLKRAIRVETATIKSRADVPSFFKVLCIL